MKVSEHLVSSLIDLINHRSSPIPTPGPAAVTRAYFLSSMQPFLVLDETTLFYYNFSSASQPKNKIAPIHDWASKVIAAKKPSTQRTAASSQSKPRSQHSAASSRSKSQAKPQSQVTTTSSRSEPRTTISSSTTIVKKTTASKTTLRKTNGSKDDERMEYKEYQEEDAGYGGFADEDESAEHQAALSSPVKGKRALNSKVRNIYSLIYLLLTS